MKQKLLIALFTLSFLSGYTQVDLGEDIFTCEGETVVLDATTANAIEYAWFQNGFIIINENGPTLEVNYTDIYEVQVIIDADTIFADTIFVTFNPSPDAQTPSDYVVCDANSGGFGVFDFTTKDAEIIGNDLDVSISYYQSEFDALAYVNALASPYSNISNPQTIWARAENVVTGCFSIVNFDLIVDPNCEDIEVFCGAIPVSIDYCYPDNTSYQYNFLNYTGSPLTLTFNSGQLETDGDYVIVIDSDGVTQLFNGNNNGDLDGLSFQSTGASISVRIETNESISCGDGSSESITFDVSCNDFSGSISGRAFFDENGNGMVDGNDSNFRNGYFTYEVNNNGIINEIMTSDGSYYIANPGEGNTYEISYHLFDNYDDCYTITTSTVSNVSVTGDEDLEINFPVTNDLMCEDLGVYVLAPFSAAPRPGFNYVNRVYIENFGFNTIASGTIEFVADDSVQFDTTLYQTNPNHVITNTSNGFILEFTDLQPGDIEFINVLLYCPASVELNQVVTNTVTYVTSGNDDFELNNTSTLSQIVVGSFDPNDKMEAHGPEVVYDDFVVSDEFLYYTIRFQNVGTADAITVRIEDVLDSGLDQTTFEMLQSSHNYILSKIDNEITWQFDNIYLPAEQDDAEGSNGFVYFRIKPQAGYALNDIIPNTASIYFDFNAPIITNTFQTEFVEESLSISEIDALNFNIYPNPAKDNVIVELNEVHFGNVTIQVIDIQGKQVLEQDILEGHTANIDTSHLQNGLYFIKLNTTTKSLIKKLVIE
ncbi:T9SS type A sorting domain-containing protein [uncultured Psychroserpens sp.]|uniref:T9SS type A sorting domain-containing protein n=1 Tax=uncultured Psychroserpens sp. TaxID=255436 RepID=UPI00261518F3|nr:T9SS type A sorting domain-containing protein [uncultured Psychroserpens sp.]